MMLQSTANAVRLQRAVFTSIGTNSVRGYHLVARSEGLDDDIAPALCQWSPAHDGLCESHISASSLNYFLIDKGRFGISHSVIGGSEYSGRSALQTVTTIVVGECDDLSIYQNNPLVLSRVALSMGWLRLITEYDEPLEAVELSHHGMPESTASTDTDPRIERTVAAVRSEHRIALIGIDEPSRFLGHVFARLNPEQRLKTSFSTGIKASTFRPFQVQFFPRIDNRLRDFLRRQSILIVGAH